MIKFVFAMLVAVSAQAATSLDVQIPSASTTGVAFSVTVTARNGAATDTAYTGTVNFTSDDPQAVLPLNYTFTSGDAGTHTFSATMKSAGSGPNTANHTITATDTTNAAVNGTDVTTVRWNDNVARRFFIAVPTVVDRTVPFQIEVRALNTSFGDVPSYTGTITFFSGRQETLPSDYTFTPADAGRHTFSVTANLGKYSSVGVRDIIDTAVYGFSGQINVLCPELVATATNSGPICPEGGAAVLFPSANLPVVGYHWVSAAGHPPLVDTTAKNPTVTRPDTYILTVREANDCECTAQTVVEAHPTNHPQVTLSPAALCGPSNLHATITNPSDFSSLKWTTAGGTIVSGQGTASVEIAPDSGSTLIWLGLEATETSSGCDASRFVAEVPVGSGVMPTVSTVTTACAQVRQSASVTDAGIGALYAWTISNGAITSGAGTRTIEYVSNGSGDVTLSATVTNGSCSGTGSAVVSFAEKPEITVQPHGTTVHSGETATLMVAASGESLRYRWYEGSAGNRTKFVGFAPTFTTRALSATTSYWVEVENDCGSEQSLTAVVSVLNAVGKRRAVMH